MDMRKTILLFVLLLAGIVQAANLPREVAKARRSVATVLAYKGGNLLGSCTAVFVGEKGDLLASNPLFATADSAVAIDNAGKVHKVGRISGASDVYGCVKLRVAWNKKIKPIAVSASKVNTGDELFLLSYGVKKGGFAEPVKVVKVDSVYSCAYYTLAAPMQEKFNSLPVVNFSGELVAIMQPASASDTVNSYAIGAAVVEKMNVTSANYGKGFLPGTAIRACLPESSAEALSCLYMQAIVGDSVTYKSVIDEFIEKFPGNYEGFMAKAEYTAVYYRDIDAAYKVWEEALSLADNKAEVYFGRGKVMNSIVQSGDTVSHPKLSFENALADIEKAIAVDNQPLYLSYKADMFFAHKDYAQAAECYEALAATNMRSATLFSKASQCYGELKEYDKAVAMLDSVVGMLGSFPKQAAPYILTRALVKSNAGRYRDAVQDYVEYENIVGNIQNAEFFYLREQAELNGKMYQQALNDIETAIYLAPENPLYYIEKGMLCYRVKMYDEGIRALDKARELAPSSPDVYYLLGRLYVQKGDKATAKENFGKALSLGHPDAEKQLKTVE